MGWFHSFDGQAIKAERRKGEREKSPASPLPETAFEQDRKRLEQLVAGAGDEGISRDPLAGVLGRKGCEGRVTLVPGDILETVPRFCAEHPELRIAMLHVDVDIHEPRRCVIEHLFPRLCPGGVLILDDHGTVPGATKAVNDYFRDRSECVRKPPFSFAPAYLIKDLTRHLAE